MITKAVQRPGPRVPIEIHPDVRTRLAYFLMRKELSGVGYSDFIDKAIDACEADLSVDKDAVPYA